MTNMNRIVHTESYGDDDVDGTDHVYADVPAVHEPAQVHQTESHRAEDQEGAQQVGQEEERGEEDTGQCQAEVSEQFPCDYFVRLPVGIFLELSLKMSW